MLTFWGYIQAKVFTVIPVIAYQIIQCGAKDICKKLALFNIRVGFSAFPYLKLLLMLINLSNKAVVNIYLLFATAVRSLHGFMYHDFLNHSV